VQKEAIAFPQGDCEVDIDVSHRVAPQEPSHSEQEYSPSLAAFLLKSSSSLRPERATESIHLGQRAEAQDEMDSNIDVLGGNAVDSHKPQDSKALRRTRSIEFSLRSDAQEFLLVSGSILASVGRLAIDHVKRDLPFGLRASPGFDERNDLWQAQPISLLFLLWRTDLLEFL